MIYDKVPDALCCRKGLTALECHERWLLTSESHET